MFSLSKKRRSPSISRLIQTFAIVGQLATCAGFASTSIAQNRLPKSTTVADATSSRLSVLTGRTIPNVTAILTPNPISLDTNTGVLYIYGDSGANNASAETDTRGTADPSDDQVLAKINLGNSAYAQQFPQSNVKEIYFQGYDSNDRFSNSTSILTRADGGAGDDWLSGGQAGDVLYGGLGNDFIYGGLGNDKVFGGPDNDNILGCEGSDTLFGEEGDDAITDYAFSPFDSNIIEGGLGNDFIHGDGELSVEEISGGQGNDTIYAFGIATVYGNEGDDVIYGTPHSDLIYGQDGNDKVYAGDGKDRVFGGSGADWLYGENGNDAILGDSGDDLVDGGTGNDFVYGGEDDDTVHGGANDDVAFGGDGADFILGDSGNDVIGGGYAAYNATTGDAVAYGDNHSDWNYDDLWGGQGSDEFIVADKKSPWFWLDDAVDAADEDTVHEIGWSGFIANVYWHPE